MTWFFQIAASGFVSGIILARYGNLPVSWFISFLVLGMLLTILHLITHFIASPSKLLLFVGTLLLGGADTLFQLDESRPFHLAAVLNKIDMNGVVVDGIVSAVPDNRERYTILPVTVNKITTFDEIDHPVRSGKLYVKVYPSYGEGYRNLSYGDRIQMEDVQINFPRGASNPGSFDMKRFLKNQHYYGLVSIRNQNQLSVLESRIGNPLIFLAETIKHSILDIIKKTLPYPESSFLGGVLLGLRSGLSDEVRQNFKGAGVSHVLAVSGLHVTIITLFFTGLLTLLPVPKSTKFIIIVTALFLFTLITGARPSAIRAAIMNGVTLIFYYFHGFRLDRSFMLGICIAALVILTFQPLVLEEASFLFSFAAVMSLSLWTRPFHNLACRYLRGFFPLVLVLTALAMLSLYLVDSSFLIRFWHYWVMCAIVLLISYYVDTLWRPLVQFRQLPKWFTVFAAAQLAIQFGMYPLTAYFFKKVSVTAVFANFICIPLIGIIVQLGLLAGILGAIPIAGPYLALTLNAANWLAIKLFLGTAEFFGAGFPYPDIAPPRPGFLIVYYAVLLLVGFHEPIVNTILPKLKRLRTSWRNPPILARLTGVGLLVCCLVILLVSVIASPDAGLKCYFFDASMFGMGGGNSVLLSVSPGFTMLIDGGPSHLVKKSQPIPMNVGANVIIPAMLQLQCKHINAVVLSSASLNHAGGLLPVIQSRYFKIDALYHALPLPDEIDSILPDDLLTALNDPSLFDDSKIVESRLMASDIIAVIHAAKERNIPVNRIREGFVFHQSEIRTGTAAREIEVKAIHPAEHLAAGRYSAGSNSLVISASFGTTRILLSSNIDKNAERALLEREVIASAVLQIPSHGNSFAVLPDFIDAVSPKIAVMSPLLSVWNRSGFDQTQYQYQDRGIEVFRTDHNGCVSIFSDGNTFRVETYLDKVQKEYEL